jgi:hypothetical protein
MHLPRPTGANDTDLEFFIHSRSGNGMTNV